MLRMLFAFVLALGSALPAAAQSTAINGTIEGTVNDEQGALLPGVTVTVTNIDTGDHARRSSPTRAACIARRCCRSAPTASPRSCRASRSSSRPASSLRAGQTAVIDVTLERRRASPRRSPSPPIRRSSTSAKIEQGRTLTEAEIKTLPLTSRNPYNFALLQPGVVGFENNEFGVPRLTANGALLRVNYQIDGSNNTQKDRAGLRQMPMSEVMIREVKVVTTGYAPEFGQTMGLVYNAITPSGTNTLQGPGQLPLPAPVDGGVPVLHAAAARRPKPPTDVNVYTVRPRRPDRRGQDALLRRLRAHRARPVGPAA